jgi:hypothetical protein
VPHDPVSRQHAALVHAEGILGSGITGSGGSTMMHIMDLGSTLGTHLQQGATSGWKQLPANSPVPLTPGCKVRLGECKTLLVYPVTLEPAAPAAQPPPKPVSNEPQFSTLMSSRIVRPGEADAEPGDGGEAATAGQSADAAPAADEEEEEQDALEPLKNADFRAALLPFLHKKPEAKPDPKGKKGAKRRKGEVESDSDEGGEVQPLVLDKAARDADAGPGPGIMLRKNKGQLKQKKSGSSVKIKF